MKSWFLRLIAVFMAFVLCVAISACGKDDAGEENSLAPGQTASGEVDSFSTGNSTPLEPVLPPDEESDVQPVGGGGDTLSMNVGAPKALEKCGFILEGRERELSI